MGNDGGSDGLAEFPVYNRCFMVFVFKKRRAIVAALIPEGKEWRACLGILHKTLDFGFTARWMRFVNGNISPRLYNREKKQAADGFKFSSCLWLNSQKTQELS